MQHRTGWSSFAGAGLAITLALGFSGSTIAHESTPVASPIAGMTVDANLHDAEGNDVGYAALTDVAEDGIQVNVFLETGTLSPAEHGIHIHERGECQAEGDEPFSSAGGHYNPTNAKHGGVDDAEAHAGDLGNITVDEDGSASIVISTDRFTLSELKDKDGSALIIHADRDDLQTDPSGNSGTRVVCGVIFPGPDEGGTEEPIEGTPIAEAIQSGLATALPNVDEPQPDSDETASPEPAQ